MKVLPSDILCLIYSFLVESGNPSIAKKVATKYGVTKEQLQNDHNPLQAYTLLQIIQAFLKLNPELKKLFRTYKKSRHTLKRANQDSPEEEVIEKIHHKKKAKVEEPEIIEEPIQKKHKKSKKEKKSGELEIENQEPAIKVIEELNDQPIDVSQEEMKEPIEEVVNEIKGGRKFFRIQQNVGDSLKKELKDNSYSAKQKFGEKGDAFGEKSYMKLVDKKGKHFKKEKTKLKNKQFHGAGQRITYSVNSVKFDDADSD